ncbi:MAG: hypothetical protein ACM31L_06675 [Actinomycetota bacterium]
MVHPNESDGALAAIDRAGGWLDRAGDELHRCTARLSDLRNGVDRLTDVLATPERPPMLAIAQRLAELMAGVDTLSDAMGMTLVSMTEGQHALAMAERRLRPAPCRLGPEGCDLQRLPIPVNKRW